jgi:hypothetical protein
MTMKAESTRPEPRQERSQAIWMGFANRTISPSGMVRIRIRWPRVGGFLLIMGVLAWLGKSVALYYFFKEFREFEDVRFSEMLAFPLNRATVRINQGNYQIEQGQLALEREDYRRALGLLRDGVARSPSNILGRQLLAQIYAGWRPELAVDIMVEGAEFGFTDKNYTQLLCMLLLSRKEDLTLLELSEALLLQNPPPETRQILEVSRLQAAINRGDFGLVKELFETTNLKSTLDGVLLGTRAYQRTGRQQTAANVLVSIIKRFPTAEIDVIYSQLVSIYKEMQEYDKAREAALELVIRNPLEWRQRVVLIDILSASKMEERRDREINAMLQQHRNDEPAMTALAQLAAEYGDVRAASRLYEIALENGYTLSLFSLTLAEALINDRQFQRAIDLCNELVREDPAWLLNAESSFNAIRSLAYYNLGNRELGDLYLKNFLDSQQSRPIQFYQAAKSFRKFELNEAALKILQEGYKRDDQDERILLALVQVEMAVGAQNALNAHLRRLFELRRPEYTYLEAIHRELQSDRFLFTEGRQELLQSLADILAEKETFTWEIWEKNSSEDASRDEANPT